MTELLLQLGAIGAVLAVVAKLGLALIDGWQKAEAARTKHWREAEDARTEVVDRRLGELVAKIHDHHERAIESDAMIASELGQIRERLDNLEAHRGHLQFVGSPRK